MVAIKAICDGEKIVLPRQISLPVGDVIVVFVETSGDMEKRQWSELAAHHLSRAYGDDEPEYPTDRVKEPNPEYRP